MSEQSLSGVTQLFAFFRVCKTQSDALRFPASARRGETIARARRSLFIEKNASISDSNRRQTLWVFPRLRDRAKCSAFFCVCETWRDAPDTLSSLINAPICDSKTRTVAPGRGKTRDAFFTGLFLAGTLAVLFWEITNYYCKLGKHTSYLFSRQWQGELRISIR